MNIAVIGVNHNKTPIQIREKVAFTEARKIEATDILLDKGIREVIILSTCNRSEIYIVSKYVDADIRNVKEFYMEYFNAYELHDYFFVKKDRDAIEHIFNVASGLDSIVLGEDQILGQAKEALQFSIEVGSSKKILNKLFREAITSSKEIKSKFRISEIPLSTSYIGIKFLKEKLGTLEGKKALIIGAGKISTLSLQYLGEENLDTIFMTNRTHGKLKKLPVNFSNLSIIRYEQRYDILDKVDILITATSAPHTIIRNQDIKSTKKTLYIMDLALPRDVEESIGELENVILYDVDDLNKISQENMKKREKLSKEATVVIDQKIVDFMEWMKGIKIDPVIKALNNKCKVIQEDTLEYINRKMDLTNREKKIIEKMINSALKRVIREPITNFKQIDEEEKMENYIEMMNELFEL